jgi:tripartite-type tricarboxylate transporter receptor subunit TctC
MFPDLPTVASTVPGYEKASIGAMFVPAKTPESIINRLNQEIGRFMKTPEARQRFANVGSEAVSSSPEELAATMKAEMARLGKVIKDARIRAN